MWLATPQRLALPPCKVAPTHEILAGSSGRTSLVHVHSITQVLLCSVCWIGGIEWEVRVHAQLGGDT